ncbi:hypothetical protein [Methylobacterium sp. 37f]|uniref:hypothetical protein n=1 Tax=Methylobacterium sp. 37f TaxID=2817058 RepID=UPI001FFCF99E|nr:hypothetical protein [Methylobacterium sp. 37f]MCK2057271.1 hypothetical protein [Methylobacterium sp. 37f]
MSNLLRQFYMPEQVKGLPKICTEMCNYPGYRNIFRKDINNWQETIVATRAFSTIPESLRRGER